jgi:prepilin-type N-terminal cleavage/methylation domain-containing protein
VCAAVPSRIPPIFVLRSFIYFPALPMKRQFTVSARPRGFTLIELMTTITIIAIMAGLLIAALKFARTTANRNKASAHIKAIELGLKGYKKDYGYYPVPKPGGGAMVDVSGTQFSAGGAVCLYQALSGDGDDAMEGGASGSTGKMKSAADANVYWDQLDAESNPQRVVLKKNGIYLLVDPWGCPFQFHVPPPPDPTHPNDFETLKTQYHNTATYDLYSYGGLEEFQNQKKWLTNW